MGDLRELVGLMWRMSLDISRKLNLWDWYLVTGLLWVKLLCLIVLREVPEWLHVNFFLVYIVELIDSGTHNRPPMFAEWRESWLRNDPWHPSHCNIVLCCVPWVLQNDALTSFWGRKDWKATRTKSPLEPIWRLIVSTSLFSDCDGWRS